MDTIPYKHNYGYVFQLWEEHKKSRISNKKGEMNKIADCWVKWIRGKWELR